MRAMTALTIAGILATVPARAEFAPERARELNRADTAAWDAPVSELGHGPRPWTTLGGEFGLWHWRYRRFDVAWSWLTVIGLHNATWELPPALELLRTLYGTSIAIGWHPTNSTSTMEVSAGLMRAQARPIGDYDAGPLATPTGIAFGGGGLFVELGLAHRQRHSDVDVTLRVGARVHATAIAAWMGKREIADLTGNFFGDGILYAPTVDVTARLRGNDRWQPMTTLHGEWFVPVDPPAKLSGYLRWLAGVCMVGRHGELTPFLGVDIGSGPGLLINRHELRVAVGVRYAPK